MLARYPGVIVITGDYRVVKPYEMPIGSWCSSFDEIGNSLDYGRNRLSGWADEEMSGYSFGIAWTNGEPAHMLNVMIIDDNGTNRIAFYEPQDCFWVKPGEVARIILN